MRRITFAAPGLPREFEPEPDPMHEWHDNCHHEMHDYTEGEGGRVYRCRTCATALLFRRRNSCAGRTT